VNGLFHIGTGQGLSIGRISELVAEVVGRPELIRFDARATPDAPMPVQISDVTAARERLGWTPPTDVENHVTRAAEWWVARLNSDATAEQPQEVAR